MMHFAFRPIDHSSGDKVATASFAARAQSVEAPPTICRSQVVPLRGRFYNNSGGSASQGGDVVRAWKIKPILLSLWILSFIMPILSMLVLSKQAIAHDDCEFVGSGSRRKLVGPNCIRERGTCKPSSKSPEVLAFCNGIPDPVETRRVHATWLSTGPINPSLPTIRIFVPTGTWGIEGVGTPFMTTPQGSMTVEFEPTSLPGNIIVATILDLSLTIPTSPVGQVTAHMLQQHGPFIETARSGTDTKLLITPSSYFAIEPDSGHTDGAIGTFNSTGTDPFTFKGLVGGNLNFADGTWSWNVVGVVAPIPIGK